MDYSEKQQQSDHDLLITLNTKVDLLTKSFNTMNDGLSERIGKFEARIKVIEDSHAGIDTRVEVNKIRDLEEEMKDNTKRWRFIAWALAPIYLAIIGFIMNNIFNLFEV